MAITLERLVSRRVAVALSKELDLAGIKASVNRILFVMIVIGAMTLVVASFVSYILFKLGFMISASIGIGAWVLLVAVVYFLIEYRIDGRKTKMESMLPDYFMLTAANLRSGIALDRAMLLAARPEFSFFGDDIREMSRKLFSGETLENALGSLVARYKSNQLKHSVRMMIESIRYGGAMADLLNQLSKDIRAQQLSQKEISSQMLMYSIFVLFAGLIAAPVLYGLTSQMITVTTSVWKGILQQNPNGLPTTGVSFLKPSPPQITAAQYQEFSLIAIAIITAFSSLIMSAISSGSALKGMRYLPIFIIVGIVIYFGIAAVVAGVFGGITTGGT